MKTLLCSCPSFKYILVFTRYICSAIIITNQITLKLEATNYKIKTDDLKNYLSSPLKTSEYMRQSFQAKQHLCKLDGGVILV